MSISEKGKYNPGFIGDDGQKSYTPSDNFKSQSYVLEVTDTKKLPKDDDYEPYSHRKVEHPTT